MIRCRPCSLLILSSLHSMHINIRIPHISSWSMKLILCGKQVIIAHFVLFILFMTLDKIESGHKLYFLLQKILIFLHVPKMFWVTILNKYHELMQRYSIYEQGLYFWNTHARAVFFAPFSQFDFCVFKDPLYFICPSTKCLPSAAYPVSPKISLPNCQSGLLWPLTGRFVSHCFRPVCHCRNVCFISFSRGGWLKLGL